MSSLDSFKYHYGFLNEDLNFIPANQASEKLRKEGLFHSWFEWLKLESIDKVLLNWKAEFSSKNFLFLARPDCPLEVVLANYFNELGFEILMMDFVPETKQMKKWVQKHAVEFILTDPYVAASLYLAEERLITSQPVVSLSFGLEIKDLNWQFTGRHLYPKRSNLQGSQKRGAYGILRRSSKRADSITSSIPAEVIVQEQPHWCLTDFIGSISFYLMQEKYPHFYPCLGRHLLPGFLQALDLLEQPQLYRGLGFKMLGTEQLALMLDPKKMFLEKMKKINYNSPLALLSRSGHMYTPLVECYAKSHGVQTTLIGNCYA